MTSMESKRIEGFPPVLGSQPKVLILGSMPSVLSLEKAEYYGNPQNRFWQIMNHFAQREGHPQLSDYKQRLEFLKQHHIALWDVVGSCVRRGSSDAMIREVKVNAIDTLLLQNPGITFVFANGQSAGKLLLKHFESLKPLLTILPSTSPANAKFTLPALICAWNCVWTIANS